MSDILKNILPASPSEGPPLPGALKQKWPSVIAGLLPKDFELSDVATKLFSQYGPKLPKEVDPEGKISQKINGILAPVFINKVLPPMPSALSKIVK